MNGLVPSSSQAPSPPETPADTPPPPPMRTGYCFDSAMTLHTPHGAEPDEDNEAIHPEKPQRITRIHAALAAAHLLERMEKIPIRPVRRNEVMLVHTKDLVDKIEALQSKYVERAYSRDRSILRAAFSVRNSFAIVRPPGHHAEPDEHMGFCFYNNVAVATRVIQNETNLKRILILDWDVHHGNGTQQAFEDDPDVLYISIHRYDEGNFYPGGTYGSMNSVGLGAGRGKSVNIPWPSGDMGDAEYMYAFLNLVMPIAYEFAPEFVFISAGFDAALGDTLGGCEVTPACYAHMTALLCSLAGGKVVAALEGGYNLDSISKSAVAVVRTLLGDRLPELPRLVASEIATEVVWQVSRVHSQYWRCINPLNLEPKEEVDETTIFLPELFKSWRREKCAKQFGLFEFPWADPELDDAYKGQLLVSGNLSKQHTLVLFVHDFGNVGAEVLSLNQVNIGMENTWIIDTSSAFLKWCVSQDFSIIDLNMHPIAVQGEDMPTAAEREASARTAILNAWDNLAELSDAKEIIVVAHGSACLSVIKLIVERFQSVQAKVKGVVQICGIHNVPKTPRYDMDTRNWYFKNSLVILPQNHPIYNSDTQIIRRHGKIHQSTETRVTKVMNSSLTMIRKFIDERVTPRGELVGGVRLRQTPPVAQTQAVITTTEAPVPILPAF